MNKDGTNSTFDFDSDPEFNENFYKNIEEALGEKKAADEASVNTIDKVELTEEATVDILNTEDTTVDILNTDETTENVISNEISAEENETTAKMIETEDTPTDVSVEEADIQQATEEEIEDQLTGINAALAKQICEEMDVIGTEEIVSETINHRKFRIQSGILLTLLCLIGFGFFFGFTQPGNQLLMKMGINLTGKIWSTWTGNFEDSTDVVVDEDYLDADDLESDAPEYDPAKIVWTQHPGEGRKEEGVYNILLLGEEAIGMGNARGRTDVLVIATLNTKTKKLMLTSLMRDMLVQIPGYQDNKLNSAFEKGGLDLMYETIALNFDIQLDGCVMVNFENFEKIIDKLGGLELTLTEGEAKYLNTTNYISKKQYRNVKAGTQLMNGNQVLGYSRVRKRSTITGNNNDYGRTDRHRIVLNAIFEKYKTKSKVELANIMFSLLPMIKTDIDDDCFEVLLNSFIEMGTSEITQLRIPADKTFTDNVKVRGMSVLIPDLAANIEVLHREIFGEEVQISPGATTNSTTGTTAEAQGTNSSTAAVTSN